MEQFVKRSIVRVTKPRMHISDRAMIGTRRARVGKDRGRSPFGQIGIRAPPNSSDSPDKAVKVVPFCPASFVPFRRPHLPKAQDCSGSRCTYCHIFIPTSALFATLYLFLTLYASAIAGGSLTFLSSCPDNGDAHSKHVFARSFVHSVSFAQPRSPSKD